MPLQPKFSVSQESDFVTIEVHVPYVRVGDAEIVVDGKEFSLWCQPYLLKLVFPCELADEEHSSASYDPDKSHGTLTVKLLKAVPGQDFRDLDLPSRLLAPPPDLPTIPTALQGEPSASLHASGEAEDEPADDLVRGMLDLRLGGQGSRDGGARRPLIEVVGEEAAGGEAHSGSQSNTAAESAASAPSVDVSSLHGYGFNRGHRGMFATLRDELRGLVQLADPEGTAAVDRPAARMAIEDSSFDSERYLGDWAAGHEDPVFQEACGMLPWWATQAQAAAGGQAAEAFQWTENERTALSSVRAKEVLVDGLVAGPGRSDGPAAREPGRPTPETDRLLAALAGMLFAYCYDHRTTGGESTVESGWTMSVLSPALACLDDELSPPQAEEGEAGPVQGPGQGYRDTLMEACAAACTRRALIFPYMRRLDLGQLCVQDAAMLLTLGRRPLLRALLSMRHTFAHDTDDKSGAPRYLLNTLWLDEMIAWLQAGGPGAPTDALLSTAGSCLARACVKVDKGHPALASLGLLQLEEMAQAQDEEEEDDEDEDASETEDDDDSEAED